MLKQLFDRVVDRHSAMVLQLMCLLVLYVIGLGALMIDGGNKEMADWVTQGAVIIAIIAIIRGVDDSKRTPPDPPSVAQ